ncbi:hypothetical protein DOTSEDRAFT_132465 [Dothistroma septosporum NZE10]|uniref:Uncharacterized protein n=1 Tax=Dothistroma septosporum (strain NZE10 / CBS 128990) TaxID=675120 RepID=M2YLC6_DOTSN|nr:hypothetical protein DOTSEDRAFT_132465 [Dothistroma septosporum NZE10]
MPPGRYWEFLHLQDTWKNASHFDRIPSAGNLYIGGISAFHQDPNPLTHAKITHILSILDFALTDADAPQLATYKHLHIDVNDDPDEDLLKHFPETTSFIDDALTAGGGVFVHCAMGVSRSGTVVCGFLIWKFGMGAMRAVEKVREGRKRVCPNEGFMAQLEVWEGMCREKGGWDEEVYRKWKERRGRAKM